MEAILQQCVRAAIAIALIQPAFPDLSIPPVTHFPKHVPCYSQAINERSFYVSKPCEIPKNKVESIFQRTTSVITLNKVFHVDPWTSGKGERRGSLMNFRESVTLSKKFYAEMTMPPWTLEEISMAFSRCEKRPKR